MKKIVCNKLKGLIAEKNFTYSTIANVVGKSDGTITEKMNGKRDWNYKECILIANLFNKSVEEVFPEIFEGYSKIKPKEKVSKTILEKLLTELIEGLRDV